MQFWKVGHPSLNKGCESLLKHNNSYDFLFWSNCFPFRAAVIKPDQHHKNSFAACLRIVHAKNHLLVPLTQD